MANYAKENKQVGHTSILPQGIRFDLALAEMKERMFKHDPLYLVETIAKHYASLAHIAMQLRESVEYRRRAPSDFNTAQTDELIEYLRKEIVRIHFTDFGVLPSWELLARQFNDQSVGCGLRE